jgi:hypothetical protein
MREAPSLFLWGQYFGALWSGVEKVVAGRV